MILSSLGSGMWYKVRLEFYVTNKEVDENGFIFTGVSKFEKLNPRLALVHHLVPKFSPWTGLVELYAEVRLHRVLTNETSCNCTFCNISSFCQGWS